MVSNEFVRAAALRLHALARWDDPARRLACEEIVLDLVGWACGEGVRGRERGSKLREAARRRMGSVAEMLRDEGGEELSLERVSSAARRHAAHVCREFRAAFGCSLTEYHMLARMERASVLLRTTDRSLARVALESGFYDQAQFSRAFRRVMGVTAGAYRRGFAGGCESGSIS
jgi:AraC family transcriptional regulator